MNFTPAEKAANAAVMFGTNSPQHQKALAKVDTNENRPARTTRPIRLGDRNKTTIPTNTDTTARYSAGNETLVVISYKGRSHLVPTTAVRFL